MLSKSIKNKMFKRNSLVTLNNSDECKVSNASKEIMLYRFCNGKEIEFPFDQYL